MKKLLAIFVCAVMCVTILAACDKEECVHTKGDWEYDEEGHWQANICSSNICDLEPSEKSEHIDENKDGICDVCDYQIPEHKHTYQDYQDESGHSWSYTCGCMTPPNLAQHFDANNDGRCDDCGALSIGSPDIAQIVLDYELSLVEELDQLRKKHPEYKYYYNSVDKVHCTLSLDSEASADEIVAKYDMNNLFEGAYISAINVPKMVLIIFERNEFTDDVHQKLKQISEDEALVENLFIDMYRDWYQSYMPRIEYYTSYAKELNYTETKQIINEFDGKDVILKSKDEYDAYLDKLLERAEYDEVKDRINAARNLYDEAFFEEKALIITRMVTRGSSSIKLTVNNLYVSGKKIYVVIRTDEPSISTDDETFAYFGFAIDKNDVTNINEVITLK